VWACQHLLGNNMVEVDDVRFRVRSELHFVFRSELHFVFYTYALLVGVLYSMLRCFNLTWNL
jgi:hypothetical protein